MFFQMTLGAKSAEVFPTRPRTQTRIQAYRRIKRVGTQPAVERVMKSGAGKALKQVNEGDGAGVIKSEISKN